MPKRKHRSRQSDVRGIDGETIRTLLIERATTMAEANGHTIHPNDWRTGKSKHGKGSVVARCCNTGCAEKVIVAPYGMGVGVHRTRPAIGGLGVIVICEGI